MTDFEFVHRWMEKQLSKYPTMDVYAFISPLGDAERVNTIHRKTFYAVDGFVNDHAKYRWLVASDTADDTIGVIDLWQTSMVEEFPYKLPYWINERFDNVDQAIGFVALNLVT